ncbi:hypothetical protein CEXT_421071 [Caerostris extrusa]|uniref:Uncharacterized protein n=1 Tax=Caerostris extrusa TaxID=172846 RepID=A0AAV4XLS5_CAEEX|nr:hypothetical protein CEXT_421071 [Caerostris extrusa]
MHTAYDKASKPKHFHSNIKLPLEIKSKIKERNRTRKLWQRTRDPTLKTDFQNLNCEIKDLISNHKNIAWENFTDSLNDNTKNSGGKVKSMRKSLQNIPPLETDANRHSGFPCRKGRGNRRLLEAPI